MQTLSQSLNDKEREELTRYVAGTKTGYLFSPFDCLEGLATGNSARQGLAMAISPQEFDLKSIADFVENDSNKRRSLLLAMANPHVRESMPFGTSLADIYRFTVADEKVTIKQTLEDTIKSGYEDENLEYNQRVWLPLEELASRIVVNNFGKMSPQMSLESEAAQIMPQVLQTNQPTEKLREVFPDINIFVDKYKMKEISKSILALQQAINNPNQIPPGKFWQRLGVNNDRTGGFSGVTENFIRNMYQSAGEGHLQKWQDVVASFQVTEGQKKQEKPIQLVIVSDYEISVLGPSGLKFALVRGEDDGQWHPRSYYDPKKRESFFTIANMSYDKLKQLITRSPFIYKLSPNLIGNILREPSNKFAENIYGQIKSGVYPVY